ncbi:hypothetical protein SSX86_028476 [Deinandra increscens subsp. villosa]|uniref:RRM domain-containing protein n=1 Tax=Deinandra increscens subsp. villosa TaxID=3103831 RepID=A0AAP0CEB5_9ASTR
MSRERESVRDPAAAAEEPWTVVQGRKKASDVSFFVTGFPDMVSTEDFWKAFHRVGKLWDVFISRKKRFNKENFGFLRFKEVHDLEALTRRLNEIKVRNTCIKANLSTVPRREIRAQQGNRQRFGRTSGGQKAKIFEFESGGDGPVKCWAGKSFRDATVGRVDPLVNEKVASDMTASKSPEAASIQVKMRRVEIPMEALEYPVSFKGRSLIAEAIDGEQLTNIKALRHEAGEADFDVTYVGGLHVLLVFNSQALADDFLTRKASIWPNFCVSMVRWDGQEFPRKRVACLKILGVPLHIRDDITYNTVGADFGKIIWPSNSSWLLEDSAGGEVQILTDSWRFIDEMISIAVGDITYTVMVKEGSYSWVPSFVEDELYERDSGEEVAGERRVQDGEAEDWSETEARDRVFQSLQEVDADLSTWRELSGARNIVENVVSGAPPTEFEGTRLAACGNHRSHSHDSPEDSFLASSQLGQSDGIRAQDLGFSGGCREERPNRVNGPLGSVNSLSEEGPNIALEYLDPANDITGVGSEPDPHIPDFIEDLGSDLNWENEIGVSLPILRKTSKKFKKGRDLHRQGDLRIERK